MAEMSADEDRFWGYAEEFLERPGVTRSTMMGLPCLRVEEKFFASYDRRTGDLLVKQPAARVDLLVEAGEAHRSPRPGARVLSGGRLLGGRLCSTRKGRPPSPALFVGDPVDNSVRSWAGNVATGSRGLRR